MTDRAVVLLSGGLDSATVLAMARASGLECYALSVAYGDHPVATSGQLRLQVYSDLAYGAQAIQYFTYWTPPFFPPGRSGCRFPGLPAVPEFVIDAARPQPPHARRS